MEDNKKIEEDFADFGEEQDFVTPNMDELDKQVEEKEEDIVVPDFEDETQSLEENKEKEPAEQNTKEETAEVKEETITEETAEKPETEETAEVKEEAQESSQENASETPEQEELRRLKEKYEENSKKVNNWEELDSQNDIVKRYIIYVDKENIEAIDKLSVDDRNHFINSAIKMKFENNDIEKVQTKRKRLIIHSTVMICTIIIFMPIAIYLAHLSIVATFKNYKYSQDNFEKLYRESFSKSPTYIKAQKYMNKQK